MVEGESYFWKLSFDFHMCVCPVKNKWRNKKKLLPFPRAFRWIEFGRLAYFQQRINCGCLLWYLGICEDFSIGPFVTSTCCDLTAWMFCRVPRALPPRANPLHNRFVGKGYSQDLEFYLPLLLTEQHGINDMTAEFSFVLQNTRIPIDEQLSPKKVVGVTKTQWWLKS